MKRKAQEDIGGPRKKPKIESAKEVAQGPSLLEPLLNAGKIRIQGKKLRPQELRNHELYKKFDNVAKPKLLELKEGEKRFQLANFIINQLPKQGAFGSLDYLNLQNKPLQDKNGLNIDLYDPHYGPSQEQVINLSPNNNERNPITTLMHEGVHALDDMWMRTYQNEAINYLADQEKNGNLIDDQLKALIEGVQNIIGRGRRDTFTDEYTYNDFFKPNIDRSFSALTEKGKPPITNFQQAKAELDKIRGQDKDPGDAFLVPFSEFPAFAMEKLFYPWKVDESTNPQSKEFLGNIMTNIRQNFKRMGGGKEQFRQEYPDVYQAFKDRKAEYGNPKSLQNPNPTNNVNIAHNNYPWKPRLEKQPGNEIRKFPQVLEESPIYRSDGVRVRRANDDLARVFSQNTQRIPYNNLSAEDQEMWGPRPVLSNMLLQNQGIDGQDLPPPHYALPPNSGNQPNTPPNFKKGGRVTNPNSRLKGKQSWNFF